MVGDGEQCLWSALEGYCVSGQALSKRIHYGKFVAEAKFAADPAAYTDLIRQKDVEGLMAMLTDASVEAKVGFTHFLLRIMKGKCCCEISLYFYLLELHRGWACWRSP